MALPIEFDTERLLLRQWHPADPRVEVLGLPEIVSFTTVSNLRSCVLMERLRMQRDADTFEHPAIPVGNKFRKHCLYRLSNGQ